LTLVNLDSVLPGVEQLRHRKRADQVPRGKCLEFNGGGSTLQSPAPPLLEATGLVKQYGHVEALRGADFTVYSGEVVALVGDNGAGKSTLIKIIAGSIQPDSGELRIDGQPVVMNSPFEARDLGIETVYQDLSLAGALDTAANLFLGREIVRSGFLGRLGVMDKKAMEKTTREVYNRFGVDMRNAASPVANLSGGQKQSVAVARAIAWPSRMVILDEPTAALGVAQTASVLSLIRRVRDDGRSVVLITHNMPQALEVSDRVEVLRMGQRVARFTSSEARVSDLVDAMTGATADRDASDRGDR
jgi:simple sugar transport system ATP-binding protein